MCLSAIVRGSVLSDIPTHFTYLYNYITLVKSVLVHFLFDILCFLRETNDRVIDMNLFSKQNVLRRMISLFLCLLAGFLIFERDGRIAIRNTDDGTVYQTEFPTVLLPPSDRRLLQAGIRCETPADAARVLENFNS